MKGWHRATNKPKGKCADLTLAPQRGANSTPLRPSFGGLRAALAASGPRLGRSSAWGVPPPGPPGLRPLCAHAHGPPLPVAQEEGGKRSAQAEGRRAVRASGGKFQKGPAGPRSGEGSGGACPPR